MLRRTFLSGAVAEQQVKHALRVAAGFRSDVKLKKETEPDIFFEKTEL